MLLWTSYLILLQEPSPVSGIGKWDWKLYVPDYEFLKRGFLFMILYDIVTAVAPKSTYEIHEPANGRIQKIIQHIWISTISSSG